MASGLTINVSAKTLGAFSAGAEKAKDLARAQLQAFMRTELTAALAPLANATWKKTGETARDWRLTVAGDREAGIDNTSPVIVFQFTGTKPHNIPGAFGYGRGFGTHGRFSGMFHPGNRQNTALVSTMDAQSVRIRAAFAAFGARMAITYARAIKPEGDG